MMDYKQNKTQDKTLNCEETLEMFDNTTEM